jgi:DNA-directed RNA polymerase subunit RPC12/RpoP
MSWVGELVAKPPKPEKPTHKVKDFIGYCPECGDLHFEGDVKALASSGPVLEKLKALEPFRDYEYVCEQCKTPLARDKGTIEALEACWWCGHRRAVKR